MKFVSARTLLVTLSAATPLLVRGDTDFALEGTGSVILTCTEKTDTCTPNGTIGGISGTFNMGGGSFTCRDGGCETTVREGTGVNFGGFDSQATKMTCSDNCACKLEDGSNCESTIAEDVSEDGSNGSSRFSIAAAGFPAVLATIGLSLLF